MPKLNIEVGHKNKLNKCLEKFHSCIIPPIRCSMIRMRQCYICDSESEDLDSLCTYLKSYEKRNLVAYLSCDKCKSIVPTLLNLYEESGNYIPNSIYDGYNIVNSTIQFFRKSRSQNIKPYIEKGASIDINAYPVFHKTNDGCLNVLVYWTTLIPGLYGSDIITKTISMANIIHHNRAIFGYEPSHGPYGKCAAIWKKDIKKEYAIANEFMEFSNAIDETVNFDGLIKTKIYEYWVGELIS